MGCQVPVPAELVYLLFRKVSPVRCRRAGLAGVEGERREGVGGEGAGVPVRVCIGAEVLDDPGAEHEVLALHPGMGPRAGAVAVQPGVGVQG
jgi:hypothetical protein